MCSDRRHRWCGSRCNPSGSCRPPRTRAPRARRRRARCRCRRRGRGRRLAGSRRGGWRRRPAPLGPNPRSGRRATSSRFWPWARSPIGQPDLARHHGHGDGDDGQQERSRLRTDVAPSTVHRDALPPDDARDEDEHEDHGRQPRRCPATPRRLIAVSARSSRCRLHSSQMMRRGNEAADLRGAERQAGDDRQRRRRRATAIEQRPDERVRADRARRPRR